MHDLDIIEGGGPQLDADSAAAGIQAGEEIAPRPDHGVHEGVIVKRRLIPDPHTDIPSKGVEDQREPAGFVHNGGRYDAFELDVLVLEPARGQIPGARPCRLGKRTVSVANPNAPERHTGIGRAAGCGSLKVQGGPTVDAQAGQRRALHPDRARSILYEQQLGRAIVVGNRPVELNRGLRGHRLRREPAHLLDRSQRAVRYAQRVLRAAAGQAQQAARRQTGSARTPRKRRSHRVPQQQATWSGPCSTGTARAGSAGVRSLTSLWRSSAGVRIPSSVTMPEK